MPTSDHFSFGDTLIVLDSRKCTTTTITGGSPLHNAPARVREARQVLHPVACRAPGRQTARSTGDRMVGMLIPQDVHTTIVEPDRLFCSPANTGNAPAVATGSRPGPANEAHPCDEVDTLRAGNQSCRAPFITRAPGLAISSSSWLADRSRSGRRIQSCSLPVCQPAGSSRVSTCRLRPAFTPVNSAAAAITPNISAELFQPWLASCSMPTASGPNAAIV